MQRYRFAENNRFIQYTQYTTAVDTVVWCWCIELQREYSRILGGHAMANNSRRTVCWRSYQEWWTIQHTVELYARRVSLYVDAVRRIEEWLSVMYYELSSSRKCPRKLAKTRAMLELALTPSRTPDFYDMQRVFCTYSPEFHSIVIPRPASMNLQWSSQLGAAHERCPSNWRVPNRRWAEQEPKEKNGCGWKFNSDGP